MGRKIGAQSFEAVFEPEEEARCHVYAPSLKGRHSCGDTREEALKNITEAIEIWMGSAKELDIPIPESETVSVGAR